MVNAVVPSDLFVDGKPRALGVAESSPWDKETSRKAIGGHEFIGRFMAHDTFPVLVKASHLPQMRADITANLGARSFEAAFRLICGGGSHSYSQFDIMMNYLWFHRREEYSWYLIDPHDSKHGQSVDSSGSR